MGKFKFKELKKKIKKAQALEQFDKKVKKKNKKAIKRIMAIVDEMNEISGGKAKRKSFDDLLDDLPHSGKKKKKRNTMHFIDVMLIKSSFKPKSDDKKTMSVPDTVETTAVEVPVMEKSSASKVTDTVDGLVEQISKLPPLKKKHKIPDIDRSVGLVNYPQNIVDKGNDADKNADSAKPVPKKRVTKKQQPAAEEKKVEESK